MKLLIPKMISPKFFLLALLISGCNLINRGLSEPPLPTIVPDSSAATAQQPTATPEAAASPTATDTQPAPTPTIIETKPAEQAQANSASEAQGTDNPASTATLVVQPTQAPPTATPSPPPTDTPAAVKLPPLDSLELQLIPVADGFTKPLYLTPAGDSSGRLFVVEQAGRILILQDGTVNASPFLDIVDRVGSDGLEQGLLSVAFHPEYPNNGHLFVNYTNRQGNTVIARYNVTDNPDVADPNSEEILLTIEQPFANHNGGQLLFGPDGFLYIGMGDGGAANDPQNRAQNLGVLLGKILRLDVNIGDPYGVPQTNPFVGNSEARPEIWSYGWRNPWRFSFDSATNDMYIADVGQNQYEEVDVAWAGLSGRNYGWRLMEGRHCHIPSECDPEVQNLVLPVAEYDHSQGCSITGGYVYRGAQFPLFEGTYFYGDFCSGIIWALRYEPGGSWSRAQLMQSGKSISSFGQDESGEIYLIDHDGEILLLGN